MSIFHRTSPDVLDVMADEFDREQALLTDEDAALVSKRAARAIARDAAEFVSPEMASLMGMVRATIEQATNDVLSTHGYIGDDV